VDSSACPTGCETSLDRKDLLKDFRILAVFPSVDLKQLGKWLLRRSGKNLAADRLPQLQDFSSATPNRLRAPPFLCPQEHTGISLPSQGASLQWVRCSGVVRAGQEKVPALVLGRPNVVNPRHQSGWWPQRSGETVVSPQLPSRGKILSRAGSSSATPNPYSQPPAQTPRLHHATGRPEGVSKETPSLIAALGSGRQPV
jgi:hypothetical protein